MAHSAVGGPEVGHPASALKATACTSGHAAECRAMRAKHAVTERRKVPPARPNRVTSGAAECAPAPLRRALRLQGSASASASRGSKSARWSAVSGNGSCSRSAAMLFQNTSASSSRSASESFRNPSRRAALVMSRTAPSGSLSGKPTVTAPALGRQKLCSRLVRGTAARMHRLESGKAGHRAVRPRRGRAGRESERVIDGEQHCEKNMLQLLTGGGLIVAQRPSR